MECLLIVGFIFIVLFCIWQNNSIVVTQINYANKKVPTSFEGFRILHISDLHNKKFGNNHKRIIKEIAKIKPDIIVITGDTIDCHFPKFEVAYSFIKEISKLASVYLVSGNHEHDSNRYEELMNEYEARGVNIVDDKFIEIIRDNRKIKLLGISDMKALEFGIIDVKTKKNFENKVKNISKNCDRNELSILLAHRPDFINLYEKYRFDLVLSGHAHGGQFRCGFIKGVIAPGQGLFPKYTSGLYTKGKTDMIVSRGLGNSVIPIRIFNRPELVVINLEG